MARHLTLKELLDKKVELGDMADRWREVFGTPLAIGFVVGIAQIPIIKRCLRDHTEQPLHDYIDGLPAGVDY